MKHFSKLLVATPIVALGGGILVNSAAFTAPSASAASHTLTQNSFTAAIAGTATDGVTCVAADQYCLLEAGDYTLGGNIDLTAATAGDDYELYFSTGNTTFDLNGKALTMGDFAFIGGDATNKTVTIKNGSITGIIAPVYGSFTLSGLEFTGAISATASTLNIVSGTYTSDNNLSVIMPGNDSTINISGGTFSTTGFGIPTIMMSNDEDDTTNTLNISGGTFTSTSGVAIDLNNEEGYAEGPVVVNISGGSFTGANGGLHVMDPSLNTIKLTGGTFTATGTDDTAGAIVAWDGQISSVRGFLGTGYMYTNSTITTKPVYGGAVNVAYIGGTTTVKLPASDDDDEEGATTDETSSETSSESSESTESVGTPDSGRVTSEGGSATASALATVGAATAITSAAYLAKKHFAKKNA